MRCFAAPIPRLRDDHRCHPGGSARGRAPRRWPSPLSHVSERSSTQTDASTTPFSTCSRIGPQASSRRSRVRPPALPSAFVAIVLMPSFVRLARRASASTQMRRAALALVAASTVGLVGLRAQLMAHVLRPVNSFVSPGHAFVPGFRRPPQPRRLLCKLKFVRLTHANFEVGSRNARERLDRVLAFSAPTLDWLGSLTTIAVSRSMLLERIYLRHKTRAAERVALRILAARTCTRPIC